MPNVLLHERGVGKLFRIRLSALEGRKKRYRKYVNQSRGVTRHFSLPLKERYRIAESVCFGIAFLHLRESVRAIDPASPYHRCQSTRRRCTFLWNRITKQRLASYIIGMVQPASASLLMFGRELTGKDRLLLGALQLGLHTVHCVESGFGACNDRHFFFFFVTIRYIATFRYVFWWRELFSAKNEQRTFGYFNSNTRHYIQWYTHTHARAGGNVYFRRR